MRIWLNINIFLLFVRVNFQDQNESTSCPVTQGAFKTSNQEKAVVGKEFILPCLFNGTINVKKDNVEWSRGKIEIYVMRGTHISGSYKDRASISNESLKGGNASLKLYEVRDQDKGEYCCCIFKPSFNSRHCIYVILDINESTDNKDKSLSTDLTNSTCNVPVAAVGSITIAVVILICCSSFF